MEIVEAISVIVPLIAAVGGLIFAAYQRWQSYSETLKIMNETSTIAIKSEIASLRMHQLSNIAAELTRKPARDITSSDIFANYVALVDRKYTEPSPRYVPIPRGPYYERDQLDAREVDWDEVSKSRLRKWIKI